jgi:hypothetical protein
MSAEVDRLGTEVTETVGVMQSAAALIRGLAPQIRDAAGDRAKSMQLADELDAKANDLASAVAAHSEPTPPPVA